MRQEIRGMISEGKSKEEIKEHFVNIHGLRILAAPPKTGFFMTAWLMPIVGLGLGGALVYKLLDVNRGRQKVTGKVSKSSKKDKDQADEYNDKLKDEMKKYY